jgi:hypothetical protein
MFTFLPKVLAGVAIVGLILAFVLAWRRKRQRVALTVLVSAYVIATFAGVWDHFLRVYNAYDAKVATAPRDKGPRMVWFHQGGFAMFDLYVVYDEADHLASLPYRGVSEGCNKVLIRLVDHYYACLENEL